MSEFCKESTIFLQSFDLNRIFAIVVSLSIETLVWKTKN